MRVFVTGGTGYLGTALVDALVARGHSVEALTRGTSGDRLPTGVHAVIGNALDARSYRDALSPEHTVVHLVGVPHPSPAKALQFREIDLVSVQALAEAASNARAARTGDEGLPGSP